MRRTIAMLGVLALLGGFARAQDAATQPSTQPSVVDASDTSAVAALESKGTVSVQGKVVQDGWSRSGKVMTASFLSGEDTFQVVIFSRNKDDMDQAFGGDVAATLMGAVVRVQGKVKDYRGRPEMIISKPEQMTIVTPATTKPTTQP